MTKSFTNVYVAIMAIASASCTAQVLANGLAPGSFDMSWNSIDCGGGTSTGGMFELTGTIGQPDASTVALSGGVFQFAGGLLPGAVPPAAQCLGDANHSNTVSIDDLVIVITSWGTCANPCPPNCAGDINHDCLVSIDDLVLVITHWGACP